MTVTLGCLLHADFQKMEEIAAGRPIMLARHSLGIQKNQPPKVMNLVKTQDECFEQWQQIQRLNSKFEGLRECGLFLSFLSEGNSARFFGAFRTIGDSVPLNNWEDYLDKMPSKLADLYREHGHDKKPWEPCFWFKTERMSEDMPCLADLTGRLTVVWQNPGLVQNYSPEMKVLELSRERVIRVAKNWTGMGNVSLSFDELEEMISCPAAWGTWRTNLSSKGVYLILHEGEDGNKGRGRMYVGSATGKDGIFGRWQDYANHPHDGGNDGLKELLGQNPDAYRHFRFSVLQTLPEDATPESASSYENEWKEKLGSRVFGYNEN